MDQYPKYDKKFDVVVASEAELKALREGKAFVKVTKSAAGDIRTVEYKQG